MEKCIICGKDFEDIVKWDYDSPAICEDCEKKEIAKSLNKPELNNQEN